MTYIYMRHDSYPYEIVYARARVCVCVCVCMTFDIRGTATTVGSTPLLYIGLFCGICRPHLPDTPVCRAFCRDTGPGLFCGLHGHVLVDC